MAELGLIGDLGLIIGGAFLLVIVAERIGIPSIVAYIIAGLVMGPIGGVLAMTHDVELIAEFGIALLLFVVGLELSLDKIKAVGKVAVLAGVGQVVFTAAGGFAVSYLLGFSPMDALFLAVALTFSSTVVVVKLLDQKDDLDSLYGRIAVGIFLVQDIVVIAALTLLAGLEGADGEVEIMEVAADIGVAFLGTTGLLVAALVAARWLLPKPFRWAARRPEMLFVWALCWCFLFVMTSELLELSLEIGAFLAGISLAQLPYNDDLRRRVHPLMSFFIAVFFVTLGLQMELEAAFGYLGPAVVLSLFVLVGNPLIFMVIIAGQGYDEKTAFSTSVTVAQISEFSFIFATMGVGAGLIGNEILSIVALVGLITIAVSSYMILYSDGLYERVRKLGLLRVFRAQQGGEQEVGPKREGHVIVVGMNELGRTLSKRLHDAGHRVLAIDTDRKKLEELPCEAMLGNVEYLTVLEEAGVADAQLLISTLHIDDTNRLLAYRGRQLSVPTAIHAFDRSLIPLLEQLDVTRLIEPRRDGIEREWSSLVEILADQEGGDD